MLRHIVQRLLNLIPLLFGVTLISFIIIQLSPGDFLSEMRLNPVVSSETVEAMRRNFGLDQPLHIQYLKWLRAIFLRGDLGYSFAYHVPVTWLIGSRLLNTLILNLAALVIAWLVAIPIGIHAATRQDSFSDNTLSMTAYLGISTPTFFSGLMRQMRGNLLEVLRQDYVRTARAKGLAERPVIYKHAVRNAINPLITIFGFEIGGLLSGSAILENVVGWPGLGRLILEALVQKDLYVVMGSLLIGSITLVLGNLGAGLLPAFADPRIRYD